MRTKKLPKLKNIFKEPGCDKTRMPDPTREGKFKPYCEDHAILAVLRQLEDQRVQTTAELEKARQDRKDEAKKGYHNQTWKLVSRFICLKYADDNLWVHCATNPELKYKVNDKRLQTGHYIRSDKYPALKFEFTNLAPQSLQENKHFAGNQEAMAQWIERTHGEGTVTKLEDRMNDPELTMEQIREVHNKYKDLLKNEMLRRGISDPWRTKKY